MIGKLTFGWMYSFKIILVFFDSHGEIVRLHAPDGPLTIEML